jgi:uncharacterized protein (TIGR02300 family)
MADATPNFVPRKEDIVVVKADWGMKRTCQSCGAKFYDLGKAEIACPKCGTVFDPEASVKARRPKAVAAERTPPPAPAPAEEEEVEAAEGEEAAAEETEDEAVMEDTSELGEDEEDVAEVIENVDEEDER